MTTFTTPWPKHPLVYEINTRVWLAELSARRGRPVTLDLVPDDEIERIARYGFHAVWLMGVWTTGEDSIRIARTHPGLIEDYKRALTDYAEADCIGSPYAVSKYRVPPQLGGPEGLAAIRERFARNGIRLILDFVPNHTSTDHWLTIERPEAFVQGTEEDIQRDPTSFFRTEQFKVLAHGRDPFFPAWNDTAQVNYAHPEGRAAMLSELKLIAAQCDGVRCDMAMLMLPDVFEKTWGGRLGVSPVRASFWKEAIAAIREQYARFLFLAESYWNLEWRLQQEGFNFTYDKTLYDRLVHGEFEGIRNHLKAEMTYQDRCARFLENHDEPRAMATFGPLRSRSAAVATFFLPGFRLFHEGQFEGRKVRLPVQLVRRPVEREDLETALYYERLLSVLRDPIFQDGRFVALDVQNAGHGDFTSQSLVAMAWISGENTAQSERVGFVIVVNLGNLRSYGRISLQLPGIFEGRHYILHDQYDGKKYERAGTELRWPGLYVALEPHQAHLFEVQSRDQ